MTETQETVGTVLAMGVPATVIAWPWLPLPAFQTAAAVALSFGLGVVAYLATHFFYGVGRGITGRNR